MTVYVVWEANWDGGELFEVCTTLEQAQQRVENRYTGRSPHLSWSLEDDGSWWLGSFRVSARVVRE